MLVGRPIKLTPTVSIVDEELVLDRDRRYMVVIGREADRPRNATAEHGITWREWPVGDAVSILIRAVSTNEDTWEHAPQLISWADSDYCDNDKWPHAVENRMGEYYPAARYMRKGQIERLGRVGSGPYVTPRSW